MEFIEETFGPVKAFQLGGKIMGCTKTQVMCDRLKELISTGTPPFVMNFHNVRWINSSGVGALLVCLNKLRQNGGDIRFANLQGMARQYFHISKLETAVGIFDSVEKQSRVLRQRWRSRRIAEANSSSATPHCRPSRA